MNKRHLYLGITALTLLTVVLACGFSASTANIREAWLASDEAGSQRTTVFTPSDIFYAIVELRNAPDDTTVRAAWTAIEVENTEPNTFIDEVELTSGDGTLTFQLSNNGPWPTGRYKVDLYLNDELDRTLEFQVQ